MIIDNFLAAGNWSLPRDFDSQFSIQSVVLHAVLCQLLVAGAGTAVVGVGVYGDAASGGEDTFHLDVAGVHQLYKVFRDGVHAVLVEVAVVAEREEVQLQALALHHTFVGNIHDANLRKVGLTGDGAEGGELGAEELHPIVMVGMHVFKRF